MSDDDLIRRASRLAGRAVRSGYSAGRRVPVLRGAERGLRSAERLALTELRRRLDRVDDPYHAALSQASAMSRGGVNGNSVAAGSAPREISDTVTVVPPGNGDEPLRAAMAELLNHSIGFGPERAREYLYAVILRRLTPDEARIVAALADGSAFPSVDIAERAALGGTGRIVLRNASTVGKTAGVALPEVVPSYLTRLVGLGLVTVDDEVAGMDTQYEILLTDSTVREVLDSLRRPKEIRRSVRLSDLGAGFWQACDPARTDSAR